MLKTTATPITEFNSDQKDLVSAMKQMVHAYGALGLAAPQVGYCLRIIVCRLDCGLIEMINPQIRPVTTSMIPSLPGAGEGFEKISIKEGCLSVPKVYNEVPRFRHIEVTWHDVDGNKQKQYFSDKDSIIIQHEVDHLEGVLFIDRLGSMRSMVLQKYFKANKR